MEDLHPVMSPTPSSTPTASVSVLYPARFHDDATLLQGLRNGTSTASAQLYDKYCAHVQRVLADFLKHIRE